VAAKILVPETEQYKEDLTITKEKLGSNALEAISNGTSDGLKLAINVGAMLLVFIALMALCNAVMGWFGGFFSINDLISANTPYEDLSFEFLLGYIGRPLVWIMGIDWADSLYVGELLGIKTVLNEFVAYPRLGEFKEMGLISERSVIMSTYLLCGFANFASIGIQIGGIGALIPSRKGLLSKLGMRALIGGTVACILTATVVGMTL
jgi:CNT family concentrative nucleoside transporter